MCTFIYLAIRINFLRKEYIAAELVGYVQIIVVLSGGVSNDSITLTVTPNEQSPVSATGIGKMHFINICTQLHYSVYFLCITGSGIDFDSNPFNLTYNPSEMLVGVFKITIKCDNMTEETEIFDVTIASDNPLVYIEDDTALVRIIETTSKNINLTKD